MKKNVVIIEDDFSLANMMKENINQLEDYSCTTLFVNPLEFFASPIDSDLILLDLMLPEMNGIDAIPKIHEIFPNASIIVNSIKDDTDTIFRAIQLGAVGYIDKQSFMLNFLEVFECVQNEGAYMTPKIAKKIFNHFQKQKGITSKLSSRELQIVNGILEGLSYKMVSDKFGISLDTVRFHIKTIYRKLEINSKSELFKMFK